MLNLPVSVTSYIIISDYLKECPDYQLYKKLFVDYFSLLPTYKVQEILNQAGKILSFQEFQFLLEVVWSQIGEREGD